MPEDFEIDFDDITVMEAEGEYSSVCDIMKDDIAKEWMLETNATINSSFGESSFLLHLYYDGRVYIMSFNSSPGNEAYYNPDVRYLSYWAQEAGWNIPQPYYLLVQENIDLWRHFWETGILDSEYLDIKIGKN